MASLCTRTHWVSPDSCSEPQITVEDSVRVRRNQKEMGGIWLWGQVFSLASAKCVLEYGVECEVDEIFSHET